MKTHTNKFKQEIKSYGRQIDSIITYELNGETIELGKEELNSITPTYQSNILKSCMKQLDLDSNVDIPLGTILSYQFGLKVDGEYECLNYGNYVVYKSEKQEDTDSYKITCYDKMLYSMKDYENMNITYPITIRNYINTICNYLGLTFKNASDTFANYDKQIQNELYLDTDGNSLGYTFRDVFDELAQVTASTICINEDDDELEIRYINDTEDVITEEYFKDINVNFGEKYGKVNSIVLSRASESDNVYLRDEESVAENGLCEIKIKNNQIMNFNDRSTYLPDILEVLDGLEYYLNDFSSTGIVYYNLCDRYTISIKGNNYSCIMFNDEVNITQGLEENIHTDLMEQSETDYTKADKTDRLINSVNLIVDKQNAEIRAIAERVADVSNTISGNGSITLENAHEGILHYLEIEGDLHLLYPSNDLFPSDDLYIRDFNLIVDDNVYHLDIDYLRYRSESLKDTYIYEDGTQRIIRRVAGIGGNPLTLPAEEREDIEIRIKENSTIYLESFSNAKFKCIYLLQNQYTDYFATQVELSSEIRQTAEEINLEVSKKVGDDEIISRINQSAEQIQINADKISIEGKAVNFTTNITDTKGKYTQEDIDRIEQILNGLVYATEEDYEKYDTNVDGTINSADLLRVVRAVNGDGYIYNDGIFRINPYSSKAPVKVARVIDGEEVKGSYLNFYGGYFPTSRTNKNIIEPSATETRRTDFTTIIDHSTLQSVNKYGNGVILGSSVQKETDLYNFSYLFIGNPQVTIMESVSDDTARIFLNNKVTQTTITNDGITTPVVTQTSLEKDKKDFEEFNKGLETLKKIDIYKYHLKNEDDTKKKHIGFVIGEDYNYSDEVTSNDNDGVDIYSFVSVCCQAIKEQQIQIEELKEEIKLLKGER